MLEFGAVWLALRIHRELVAGAAASALTVESLIYDLCTHLETTSADTPNAPAWLERAEELIRDRALDHVDLREVATDVSVDPAHLCRTFRRLRHRTIGDCVLGLRIQLACRALVSTAEPLSELALRLGFTDQSHLTRMFKRMTGVTPGTYRRRQKP